MVKSKAKQLRKKIKGLKPKKTISKKKAGPRALKLQNGLFDDTLVNFPIPTRIHNRPYQVSERTCRYIPVAGTGSLANSCSFFMNPHYTFACSGPATGLTYAKMIAGVQTYTTIPCAASNDGGTTCFPTPTNFTSQIFSTAMNATTTNGFSGATRVIGVELDIEYTGTFNNSGAMLHFYHGAGDSGGLVNVGAGTWENAYVLPSIYVGETDRVTSIRIDRRCRLVWRPSDYEFRKVSTVREDNLSTAPGVTETSYPTLADVCAPDVNANAPVQCPWGFGFILASASATAAGSSMPYIIRIRSLTHETLEVYVNASSSGNVVTHPTVIPHQNSQALDKIHNQLTHVHADRRRGVVRSVERPFSGLAKELVGGAASEAGSVLAQRLAAAAGSLF